MAPGLKFCNRCGSGTKERSESNNSLAISSFLTAIVLIGLGGLGIMLGGSLVLRWGAGLRGELIGIFMSFTFLIVLLTEVMLVKNLSKLTSTEEISPYRHPQIQTPTNELRLPAASILGEPVPSVTENTTRTLEYSRRQQ